ncbi:MAG: DoxX family protein, partial [Pseudomonadota bacterium]
GLAPALLLLPCTILLEIVAGSLLAVGRRYAWISAFILAAFTLATNFYFHRFWELSGLVGDLELSLFFKNLSITGALLFVGAGLLRK